MPDVVDPIEKRLIAEKHHVAFVLRPALEVFCPEQGENGVVAHEERMRAVINVLAAEVPHLQQDFGGAVSCRQPGGNDRDAMGGIAVQLKPLPRQPAAELRLADPAIAENHQLDLDDRLGAIPLVEEMGAKLFKTIVAGLGRENFDGNAGNESLMEFEVADRGCSQKPFRQCSQCEAVAA